MKNKKGNLVADKPVVIVIAFLIVAAVLILIFRADILKYFGFIPDYGGNGGNQEDKEIDADKVVDVEVVPETTKPFLVEIVDEKGKITQSITFLDNIYLSIDKGERKCVNYKITPIVVSNVQGAFVFKELLEIKPADSVLEKEIISIENYLKNDRNKFGPGFIDSNHLLRIEVVCLDSLEKEIGKEYSNFIKIISPEIISLGFYYKSNEKFIKIVGPPQKKLDIYLVVNHAGCENNIQTDLFRRTAWWKILSGDEKIEEISIEKKDRNFVSYVIKNLQPGEYYAISTCEDNQGRLINKEQTKIDLEIIK